MTDLMPDGEPRVVSRVLGALDHMAEDIRLQVLLPAPDLGKEGPVEAPQIAPKDIGARRTGGVPANFGFTHEAGDLVARGIVR